MITIRILDTPVHVRNLFGVNQVVYLDTDEDFDMRLSKSLEQLTEANEIAQSAAATNSLPGTNRNYAIFESYEANVWKRRTGTMEVEVRSGDNILPINKLRVIGFQDRESSIEIELYGTGWVTDLEETPINSVDLGNFTYGLTQVVVDAWSDPNGIVYPALAHWGGWNTLGDVTRKDLRFVFNLYKLMDKLLCSKGWKFRSTYWESAIGSRVYGYLSDRRWYSYRNKHHQFRVDLFRSTPAVLTGIGQTVLFQELSDPLNYYNNPLRPLEYLYSPFGEPADLRVTINGLKLTLPPPPNPSDPAGTFVISVYRNRPPQFDFLWSAIYTGSQTQTVEVSLNYDFFLEDMQAGDSFGVVVSYGDIYDRGSGDPYPYTLESIEEVVFSPDVFYYVNNDVIYLADLLTSQMNGYKLFKDMAKKMNGKIKTNYATREVWLNPPFDVTQDTVFMEGFFKRDSKVQDISSLIVPKSRVVKNRESERERYLELKFVDSTDAYIDSLELKREPHSRLVDFGKGRAATGKIEMELFEPTVEVKTTIAEVGDGIDVGADTPYLPAIMDNLDGKISFDLGYRLFYCYGIVNQLDPNGDPYQISFEGNTRLTFGYVSQVPIRPRSDGTGNPKTVPLAFAEWLDDLYRLFYQRWLNEQYAGLDFEYLLYLQYHHYDGFDFREPVGFFYRDAFLIYQMLTIRDFALQDNISTPVEFKLLEC